MLINIPSCFLTGCDFPTGDFAIGRIYQDLLGSIHEDIVMDGHRQGKKHTLINTPSRSSSDDQASS